MCLSVRFFGVWLSQERGNQHQIDNQEVKSSANLLDKEKTNMAM